MSGKYSKKKKRSNVKKNQSHKQPMNGRSKSGGLRKFLWAAIIAGVVVLALLVGFLLSLEEGTSAQVPTATATDPVQDTTVGKVQIEQADEVSINLGNGLYITDVGKYTGVYMEDGTDEIVSGIMMLRVTNLGESDIEYAEIQVPVGEEIAHFSVSTLPVGASAVLLELNRMPYVDMEYTTAIADNVALFKAPLSLCEDQVKLQILDGAINVTNISGQDITGDIVIYYKNSASDVFYGGITYRARIEGGLKADELKQLMVGHISTSGSTVMFVTIG